MADDAVTRKILVAGLRVFGRDGFSRATIRAVATAAGVSRPTVYARFDGKEELLRAVTRDIFEDALSDVAAAVDQGGALADVLERALACYFGRLYDEVLSLEQSSDVLLAQARIAGDIVEAARKRMRREFDRALRAAPGNADVGVPRTRLVQLLMLAPRSFKEPGTTSREYRRRLESLARVVAHAAS